MRGVKTPVLPLLPLCAILLSAAGAVAQTTIIDIIPLSEKTEHAQNSEPNIAVNPSDPTKIVNSVFGDPTNPIFMSKDGGTTWARIQKVPAGDISVGWAGPYNAYLTTLTPKATAIATMRLHDPTIRSTFRGVPKSIYKPGGGGPDQPWTEGALVNGVDRIYVAFDDFSQASRSASIRQSLDGGLTWKNVIIERQDPGPGFLDGSAVRVAINAERVYGAFQRFNADVGNDVAGDIVVVRDDTGGVGQYMSLAGSLGVNVATGETLPQGFLGRSASARISPSPWIRMIPTASSSPTPRSVAETPSSR